MLHPLAILPRLILSPASPGFYFCGEETMGALARDMLLRKQLKSTKQDGLATYDSKKRQNTNGSGITRPVRPTEQELGFQG